ncbi:MAG: hypothetical protein KJ666_07670 [Bacteroidetes bacterium]|nr:hypothetical protein [Bacteroidota bacterium]
MAVMHDYEKYLNWIKTIHETNLKSSNSSFPGSIFGKSQTFPPASQL